MAGDGPYRTAHNRPANGPSGSPFGSLGAPLRLDVFFRQAVAFFDISLGLTFSHCFQMLIGIEYRAALSRTSREKQKKNCR
jgi:hypothetical protein